MRSLAATLALVAAGAAGAGVAAADPASVAKARAKALYEAAEQEMQVDRFADAARDYLGAYQLTADPVLFFKIASADEKAGNCSAALPLFRRYLVEAKPAQKFVDTTHERIAACTKAVQPVMPTPEPPRPAPPTPAPAPKDTPLIVEEHPATVTVQPVPFPPQPAQPAPAVHANHHVAAWLVGGGAVGLAIAGVVLAQAAHSSESDVSDLYNGLQNRPPAFDAATQKKYQDDLDEGHRYERASWVTFGGAAVATGLTVYLFARGHRTVEPIVAPHAAGAAASWTF